MKPIFVHSAVDDAGLSPAVFRVFCHLRRRDGGDGAWPSVAEIAKTCRLHEKTVRPALRELEGLGWIRRQKRDGFTDKFFVNDISQWATPLPNEYPSLELEGGTNKPGEDSQTNTPPSSQTEPPHPSQNKGDEGIPRKVLQEGSPKKAIQADAAIAIYEAYPRKQGRQDALKAIAKAIQTAGAEHLLDRTRAYAEAVAKWQERDRQFVPHPATWFNRGSYDDDPKTWVRVYGGADPWQRKTADIDHSKGFSEATPTDIPRQPSRPKEWSWDECVEAVGKDRWRRWKARNGPITRDEDVAKMRLAIIAFFKRGGSPREVESALGCNSVDAVLRVCSEGSP